MADSSQTTLLRIAAFLVDALTVIGHNHASTSDDDVFP